MLEEHFFGRDSNFHKYILWQPRPNVVVLGTLPTNNYPSYHAARSRINGMSRDDEVGVNATTTPRPPNPYNPDNKM